MHCNYVLQVVWDVLLCIISHDKFLPFFTFSKIIFNDTIIYKKDDYAPRTPTTFYAYYLNVQLVSL